MYLTYVVINDIRKNGVSRLALYLPKSILELEIKSIHELLSKKDSEDDDDDGYIPIEYENNCMRRSIGLRSIINSNEVKMKR